MTSTTSSPYISHNPYFKVKMSDGTEITTASDIMHHLSYYTTPEGYPFPIYTISDINNVKWYVNLNQIVYITISK